MYMLNAGQPHLFKPLESSRSWTTPLSKPVVGPSRRVHTSSLSGVQINCYNVPLFHIRFHLTRRIRLMFELVAVMFVCHYDIVHLLCFGNN